MVGLIKRQKLWFALVGVVLAGWVLASTSRMAKPPTATPCTEAWYESLEKEYAVSADDGEGHGPDYGDNSWFYSIGKQLGIDVPGQSKEQQCKALQQQLQSRTILISSLFGPITIKR